MTTTDIPPQFRDVVETLIKSERRLQQLGFTPDEFCQWSASGCRVTLYAVSGEWEIDITLPNGSAVGCDVPMDKFHGRTAEEIHGARDDGRGDFIPSGK